MTDFIAIIPARAGSKGLPGKNLIPLADKPLISHTIDAAIESKIFKKIIVTSDGQDILLEAKNRGALPLVRPCQLAQDSTPTDPVIADCIARFSELGIEANNVHIMLLQPTSPLRNAQHIKEAAHLYSSSKDCRCVLSICKAQESPFKCFSVNKGGFLQGHFGFNAPFSRRQDYPDVFFANGAIYIFSVRDFLKYNTIPREKIVPYFMSDIDSIDIDTKFDLKIAEFILKERCDGR